MPSARVSISAAIKATKDATKCADCAHAATDHRCAYLVIALDHLENAEAALERAKAET